MADEYKSTSNLGSGIFQWTQGNTYKTSLGGSSTCSIGPSSTVTASIDNKVNLGTANSLKYTYETAVSFGKKFEYKDVDEIDFKKSSLSILEYSGARCLDLFQASAGLGIIQRGAFEAQRATAKTAMKIMMLADVLAAISTIAMAGFGTGFATQADPGDRTQITWSMTGVTTLLSLIPTITAFATSFLTAQTGTTKPQEWNPNAIIQTSATKGVFIGAAPPNGLMPPQVGSFITQNAQGSNWTVFRTVAPPMLVGENIGLLDKQQHIVGYNMLVPMTQSSIEMSDQDITVQTSQLVLDGKTGLGSLVRTGSNMSALFADIDLTAQQLPTAKAPPNASLVLMSTGSPSATISAGALPAGSSVAATATSLTLKSGAMSSMTLDTANINMTAENAKVVGYTNVALNGTNVKISGISGVTINGTLVRLG